MVIKVGSNTLTKEDQSFDTDFISAMAAQIARLISDGIEVLIVSSGAVAAGRSALGLEDRPRTIPQKQAAAAVGQSRLMRAYEEAFAIHGLNVAQLLLTRSDLADRTRYAPPRSAAAPARSSPASRPPRCRACR